MLRHGRRGRVPLRVEPGDDAAVLTDGTVLTTDLLVEGVHFDERLGGADVGWKAVAVSASDIGAMGAVPTWMLLDLAMPGDDAWLAQFGIGLEQACRAFGVDLIGGDTTGTPGPRFVGVTMAGSAPGPLVRRSGARPGDTVLVTGIPGLAAAGYVHADPAPEALAALRRPQPPTELAVHAAALITAAMDLSDGLAQDLPRLCRASGVGARIDPSSLPDHPALHDGTTPAAALQLAGGDDYGLLMTARPDQVGALRELAQAHGVRITAIGTVTSGHAVELTDGAWPASPWRHFGSTP